jgi:hypothetical protein
MATYGNIPPIALMAGLLSGSELGLLLQKREPDTGKAVVFLMVSGAIKPW